MSSSEGGEDLLKRFESLESELRNQKSELQEQFQSELRKQKSELDAKMEYELRKQKSDLDAMIQQQDAKIQQQDAKLVEHDAIIQAMLCLLLGLFGCVVSAVVDGLSHISQLREEQEVLNLTPTCVGAKAAVGTVASSYELLLQLYPVARYHKIVRRFNCTDGGRSTYAGGGYI
eukprot:gene26204-31653_t